MLIKTIDNRTINHNKTETREAARAVIKCEDKHLMVYMTTHDSYVFPGGGIEDGETMEETCIREAREELGAVVTINRYLGYIDEFRDSKYGPMTYNLKSHYFECELVELVEQKLMNYEQRMGFTAKKVSLIDALNHDKKKYPYSDEPYIERNVELLTLLTENKL